MFPQNYVYSSNPLMLCVHIFNFSSNYEYLLDTDHFFITCNTVPEMQQALNKCLMNEYIYKCVDQNLRPQTYFHKPRKKDKTYIYLLNYWIFTENLLHTRQKEQKQIVQSYFELFQQYLSPHHKKSILSLVNLHVQFSLMYFQILHNVLYHYIFQRPPERLEGLALLLPLFDKASPNKVKLFLLVAVELYDT